MGMIWLETAVLDFSLEITSDTGILMGSGVAVATAEDFATLDQSISLALGPRLIPLSSSLFSRTYEYQFM